MTPHLTPTNSADPALDAAIRQTKAGMAYWAATAGDPKAVCGGCRHHGAPPYGGEYSARCALFRKFSGKDGKPVPSSARDCKYHEPKS